MERLHIYFVAFRNARAMGKKRNQISGQFSALLIEMLESPSRRAMSLSARRCLDRIEIELGHHGGNDNGKLPLTYQNFVDYGVHKDSVAPALRELEALGFIRITEHGRGGNAEHREPNKYFLTYAHSRDSRAAPPSHDWRAIGTIEEAEQLARMARAAKNETAVAKGKRSARRANFRAVRANIRSALTSPPVTPGIPVGDWLSDRAVNEPIEVDAVLRGQA